jgi:pimeloyl-ACP methyl ester carboxylesterase
VYVTSRKPGLVPGAAIAGIAAGYANASGEELGGPVVFHGTSAGGAVGLQLAIGYPHLVRRLVLAAAACRLSPSGRHRSQPHYLPRTERIYGRFRTAGQLTQISTCPALCVPTQGGDGGPLTLRDNHGPG